MSSFERLLSGGHEENVLQTNEFGRCLCDDQMPDVDWIERSSEYPDFHR